MITINNENYGPSDIAGKFHSYSQFEQIRNPECHIYAVCFKTSFDLICLVIYMRERNGSLLLLHKDTPFETALVLAQKANCSYLIYGSMDNILPLSGGKVTNTPALLQFSSGSTGDPKLIARTWSEIDIEISQYNLRFLTTSDERPLIWVPVSHSFGLIAGVLTALARNANPIIIEDSNPKYALHLLQVFKRSIMYAVPFQLHILSLLGKEQFHLYKLVSSGSPLNDDLFERLQDCSEEVWQQYGCTEVGCISLGRSTSAMDVGKPLPHIAVEIARNPQYDDINIDAGEIITTIRNQTVSTRDLGYITSEGQLHLLARIDDLINVSGLKVNPHEVEAVIRGQPGVREVVVHRTKHSVWGEAVKAVVVASKSVDPISIRGWCKQYLPAHKVPGVVKIVSEIPKLPNGKISRKLLESKEWK